MILQSNILTLSIVEQKIPQIVVTGLANTKVIKNMSISHNVGNTMTLTTVRHISKADENIASISLNVSNFELKNIKLTHLHKENEITVTTNVGDLTLQDIRKYGSILEPNIAVSTTVDNLKLEDLRKYASTGETSFLRNPYIEIINVSDFTLETIL